MKKIKVTLIITESYEDPYNRPMQDNWIVKGFVSIPLEHGEYRHDIKMEFSNYEGETIYCYRPVLIRGDQKIELDQLYLDKGTTWDLMDKVSKDETGVHQFEIEYDDPEPTWPL